METIEERAYKYAEVTTWDDVDGYPSDIYATNAYNAYVAGAAEQKAIDIEKAKTAFSKACGWLSTYPWCDGVFEEFIKNIEE